MHASHCTFTNVKEGFFTRGGGTVELEYNRFERNEIALKLDSNVSGHAIGNSLDGSMFGRYFRPRAFQCSANECSGSGSEAEDFDDEN